MALQRLCKGTISNRPERVRQCGNRCPSSTTGFVVGRKTHSTLGFSAWHRRGFTRRTHRERRDLPLRRSLFLLWATRRSLLFYCGWKEKISVGLSKDHQRCINKLCRQPTCQLIDIHGHSITVCRNLHTDALCVFYRNFFQSVKIRQCGSD